MPVFFYESINQRLVMLYQPTRSGFCSMSTNQMPVLPGTIVTVQTLESADCCVVGVGLDLQRLLEHCSEGGDGSVTGEGDLIAAQESTRSSVYQLNQSEMSMIMFQPITTKYSPEWSHHILRDHGWIVQTKPNDEDSSVHDEPNLVRCSTVAPPDQ